MPRFALSARPSGAFLLILAVGTLMISGCSDDSSSPETFSVQVVVTGPSGDPVSGLRISAWSLLPAGITQDGKHAASLANPARAATNFPFILAQSATVSYMLYDANDELVCSMVQGLLPAGSFNVIWEGTFCDLDFPTPAPSGAYRAELIARDLETDEILYTDEILAVMYRADPDQSILGFTDRDGRFTTEDITLFPHLNQWPPFVLTNEVGEPLGTFSYTGSVRVAVYDASTMETIFQDFEVDAGENRLLIFWDPDKMTSPKSATGSAATSLRPTNPAAPQFTRVNSEDDDPPPLRTEIQQNYPNPFN